MLNKLALINTVWMAANLILWIYKPLILNLYASIQLHCYLISFADTQNIKKYISTSNIQSTAKHVISNDSKLVPPICTSSCSNWSLYDVHILKKILINLKIEHFAQLKLMRGKF
jgi:hypothetical protein